MRSKSWRRNASRLSLPEGLDWIVGETADSTEADRQLPAGDEIFLDHVGHFVPDAQAAALALKRAGFAPTPVSVQVNPDGTPVGTGNITAMLERGYVEVLFQTADTPLAREFAAALADHAGLHLAAFSVADAERTHRRLGAAGFPMRPLVQFQRPVATETGEGIAAFTVVRLERGAMAEGRIQFLTHRTENTVWQQRWLTHPNVATGLVDMVVACADVAEAANRYSHFFGRAAVSTPFGQAIALDRGSVQLFKGEAFASMFPEIAIPRLPFLGAYAIKVGSVATAEALLRQNQLQVRRLGKALVVPFPTELGVGAWLFVENAADLPWRS